MPTPKPELLRPQRQAIVVDLEPVLNAFYSLTLIIQLERFSGLGEWVMNTRNALTPAELQTHRLVFEGFSYALLPKRNWPDFAAYLDRLERIDPIVLRDRLLDAYFEMPYLREGPAPTQSAEEVLRSADEYIDFLIGRFGEELVDPELESQAYTYLTKPDSMRSLIVTHLHMMWERFLAAEWKRVQPMLADSVAAFRAAGLNDMSLEEATHYVTGQKQLDMDWAALEETFTRIVFLPSAHVGPHVGKLHRGDDLVMLFGARLPESAKFNAPDLSRNELVIRLNALADDTRLQIMRYIADHGEACSQEIMSELGLSQSTASRQLTQLCATGYLIARRLEAAKCYSIAEDRLQNTFQAVLAFLSVSP